MVLRVVYKCADGTDFPVDWEDAKDAELTWLSMRDHKPRPNLPIESSHGTDIWRWVREVTAEAGLPLSDFVAARAGEFNGHMYIANLAFVLDPEAALAMGRFLAQYGGPKGVWEMYWLPKVRECCDRLAATDERASPRELMDQLHRVYGLTMLQLLEVYGPVVDMAGFLAQELGAEASLAAFDLTQGFPHATLEADQALWEVAQVAKASPALRAAFEEGVESEALRRAIEAHPEFKQRFERFMDVYGARAQDWALSAPTFQDRPEIPLAMIAAFLRSDAPAPDEALRRGAERREKALADLEARIADPAKKGRLRALAAQLADVVPISEGRAYWQLIAWGHCRTALLRIGARLVREGRIETPEDVLFLRLEEIEEPEGDMCSAVRKRRAEWERWAKVAPPPFVGTAPPPFITAAPLAGALTGGIAPPDVRVLRGVAASRGRVTARARLLADLAEGSRLSQGEVLVAVITAPPWTPLFAVAGAVVTETGGILSHPAITAREYGIPCVVAVPGAMARIKDGVLISVDGAAGTVTIEE